MHECVQRFAYVHSQACRRQFSKAFRRRLSKACIRIKLQSLRARKQTCALALLAFPPRPGLRRVVQLKEDVIHKPPPQPLPAAQTNTGR